MALIDLGTRAVNFLTESTVVYTPYSFRSGRSYALTLIPVGLTTRLKYASILVSYIYTLGGRSVFSSNSTRWYPVPVSQVVGIYLPSFAGNTVSTALALTPLVVYPGRVEPESLSVQIVGDTSFSKVGYFPL